MDRTGKSNRPRGPRFGPWGVGEVLWQQNKPLPSGGIRPKRQTRALFLFFFFSRIACYYVHWDASNAESGCPTTDRELRLILI